MIAEDLLLLAFLGMLVVTGAGILALLQLLCIIL